MNTKDWILLTVPIISNGILIFVFQAIIKRKFDKIQNVDNRKKVIVENFLEQLYGSIEIVSEVEKQFRFREDMKDINQKLVVSISGLCRYGNNMEYVINESDTLEQLHAKCGYCLTRLNEYEKLGDAKSFDYPMEEQEIILKYLCEIKEILQSLAKKIIRL